MKKNTQTGCLLFFLGAVAPVALSFAAESYTPPPMFSGATAPVIAEQQSDKSSHNNSLDPDDLLAYPANHISETAQQVIKAKPVSTIPELVPYDGTVTTTKKISPPVPPIARVISKSKQRPSTATKMEKPHVAICQPCHYHP
jgi:hypothetical protein